MESTIAAMTAVDLVDAYRRGALSPVEVVRDTLARAHESQTTLNAFAIIDDSCLAQAEASAARWRRAGTLGPLDGVPVSIKDNVYAAGMPTRFGSVAIPPDQTQGPDSPSTARLREAGAVIIGKTTMPDYAHKIVTDSPLTGVTRNPIDLQRSPGGSSGGASAAVAAGIGPLAVGTDGGGSIRIPACWTGIFGLKPSFGRVPHHPRGAFAPVSHVGPMTRTVRDAALMLTVMARPDSRDWYSLPHDPIAYEDHLDLAVAGLRVAVSPRLGRTDTAPDDATAAAIADAAACLAAMGAQVAQADPPHLADIVRIAGLQWAAYSAYLADQLGDRAAALDPSLLDLVGIGRRLGRHDIVAAQLERGRLGAEVAQFFDDWDLLLAPVIDRPAPLLEELDPLAPPLPPFTSWCNVTGLPAASVPAGRDAQGLPVGVQVIGRRFDDAGVLRACAVLERHWGRA